MVLHLLLPVLPQVLLPSHPHRMFFHRHSLPLQHDGIGVPFSFVFVSTLPPPVCPPLLLLVPHGSDTMANIPYEALGPELSTDHDGRNSLFFTAKIFMFIGAAAAAYSSPSLFPRWFLLLSCFQGPLVSLVIPFPCVSVLPGMLFGAFGPAVVRFSLQGGFGTPAMLPCASLSWQDDGSARLLYLQAGAPPGTCTLAEPCLNHAGLSCQRIHEGSLETGRRVYTFDLLDVEAVCGGNNNGTGAVAAAEAARCWGSPWADVCNATGEDGGGGGGLPCVPSTMWAMDDGASQRISFTIVAATFGAYYLFAAVGCEQTRNQ